MLEANTIHFPFFIENHVDVFLVMVVDVIVTIDACTVTIVSQVFFVTPFIACITHEVIGIEAIATNHVAIANVFYSRRAIVFPAIVAFGVTPSHETPFANHVSDKNTVLEVLNVPSYCEVRAVSTAIVTLPI